MKITQNRLHAVHLLCDTGLLNSAVPKKSNYLVIYLNLEILSQIEWIIWLAIWVNCMNSPVFFNWIDDCIDIQDVENTKATEEFLEIIPIHNDTKGYFFKKCMGHFKKLPWNILIKHRNHKGHVIRLMIY